MRPSRRRLLVGIVVVGLAAFVALSLLLDAYAVPTGSMEPLLHGDRSTGDRVLVLRDSRIGANLRRSDLAVFRSPDGAHCVKRAAGLPGEGVQIVGGDLYVNGGISRKDAAEFERTRVTVFDSRNQPFGSLWLRRSEHWRQVGDELELDAPALGVQPAAGLSSTRLAILDDYLDPDGRPVRGTIPVGDLALEVEWTPLGERGVFLIALLEDADRFEFRLERAPDRTVATVTRHVPREETALARGEIGPLPVGRRQRVEAMNVDNRLRLLVDGRDAVPPIDYDRNTRFEPVEGEVGLRNGARFGGAPLRARVHRVVLRRDLHYAPRGSFGVDSAVLLGPDEFFFLGDNSRESFDCRDWGPISGRDLLGRPLLIYWPPRRIRWL